MVGQPQPRDEPRTIRLPETLRLHDWPYHRIRNPNYDLIKGPAREWLRSFNAFGEKAQEVLDTTNSGELMLIFENLVLHHSLACCIYGPFL